MPRTTIVLQTKREPTVAQLGELLERLLDNGDDVGIQPLKAHGIAPKSNGNSTIQTVQRYTRNARSRGDVA